MLYTSSKYIYIYIYIYKNKKNLLKKEKKIGLWVVIQLFLNTDQFQKWRCLLQIHFFVKKNVKNNNLVKKKKKSLHFNISSKNKTNT